MHRAGELTVVYVTDAQDEAMRDLSRARENAVMVVKKQNSDSRFFCSETGSSSPVSLNETAEQQYTKELMFSTVFDMMSQVVCG